ncbi:hypothetical protein Tco_0785566 [Tanacetum coccineum]
MATQSIRCKTCAHIHTTVSEVIKKAYNPKEEKALPHNLLKIKCLLQTQKFSMTGKEDKSIKAFTDPTTSEHVSLKISDGKVKVKEDHRK